MALLDRITSYNVCYTKLLRKFAGYRGLGRSSPLNSGSLLSRMRISVITSYSIHYTKLYDLDSDGQPKRAKLSWVSPITGTLLFTDREGLKAGNYSVDEIALDKLHIFFKNQSDVGEFP